MAAGGLTLLVSLRPAVAIKSEMVVHSHYLTLSSKSLIGAFRLTERFTWNQAAHTIHCGDTSKSTLRRIGRCKYHMSGLASSWGKWDARISCSVRIWVLSPSALAPL